MKYTPINCWQIQYDVPDVKALEAIKPTFQIFKKAILKSGFRGYILEGQNFEETDWYGDFMLQEDVRFYIDGSGVYSIANIDLSENEIYFEKRGVPIGWQPWIYYCWQSDFDKSHKEIQKALEEAVKFINLNNDPIQEIRVIKSLAPGEGATNIRTALERNLIRSLLTVFDITNVSKSMYRDRYTPNGNVIFEYGLASTRKRSSQMMLIKRINNDIKSGDDDVLFDFDQIKRIEYKDMKDLEQMVLEELLDMLGYMRYLRIEA